MLMRDGCFNKGVQGSSRSRGSIDYRLTVHFKTRELTCAFLLNILPVRAFIPKEINHVAAHSTVTEMNGLL